MDKMDRDLNMSEMGPESPMEMKPQDHYPTFHYEGPEELDLPDHGAMLVHYKVKREVETKNPPDRHWYSCDVEIRKILGAEAEKDMRPSKRDTSAEDNLDRLMKEREEQE